MPQCFKAHRISNQKKDLRIRRGWSKASWMLMSEYGRTIVRTCNKRSWQGQTRIIARNQKDMCYEWSKAELLRDLAVNLILSVPIWTGKSKEQRYIGYFFLFLCSFEQNWQLRAARLPSWTRDNTESSTARNGTTNEPIDALKSCCHFQKLCQIWHLYL